MGRGKAATRIGSRRSGQELPPVGRTDLEILRMLLAGGTGAQPASEVGRELLERFGSLHGVLKESPSNLKSVRGVGDRLALRLSAAGELARRLISHEKRTPKLYLSGPEDVADMFMREMSGLDREHFRAILLNTKNRILGVRTISIGSLNASIVHAREVFKAAVAESAQAIVLVHNHPSGLPEPSSEDIAVTERLAEAGRILGIEVLDHIVLGSNGFVSLKELGHL
ncbi:MAG: DNA repair protein RadC [Candidatus Eisenbacteria bacterium]|nr:DNA repair protein RadC [Candidatus Eisenbacteria bacterium]